MKISKLYVFLIVFFIGFTHISAEKSKCVMRGPCVMTVKGGMNCLEPRPAEALKNSSFLEILKPECPDLFKNGDDPLFCCSEGQIEDMVRNFKTAEKLLSRCPSCYTNFRKIFCNFACSPNQDEFVTADELKWNDTLKKQIVTSASFYMGKTFAEGMYSSCSNVKLNPSSNAVDLMCGKFSLNCNAQRWLNYIGDPNEFAPFRINFKLTDDPLEVGGKIMNPAIERTYNCSEKPGPEFEICSCLDCEDTCNLNDFSSQIKLPPEDVKPTLWGMNPMSVITGIFGAVMAVIITIAFIIQIRSQKTAKRKLNIVGSEAHLDQNGSNANISNGLKPAIGLTGEYRTSCLDKIGTKTERALESAFQCWGTFVAKNPLKVMIPSFLLSLVLSLGIVNYQVTTDPVELWASPTSRARQDLDYFNTHFRPFYRVEQIIITPTNMENFEANITSVPGEDSGNKTWGPVFERNFFLEAYKLQRDVEALYTPVKDAKGEWKNITLRDICLQPLSPFKEECIIQSVFLFYDTFRLNTNVSAYSEDYLLRYKNCINQDANTKCFGNYGGPLQPSQVAFGSYDVDEKMNLYHTSRALVITLPVLNNVKKEDNENALAWETEFIKYMLNVNSTLMSVAFKAERSVEDELERTSQGDIPVVAASYMIMFVYIAIALGDLDFSSFGALLTHTKVTLGFVGVVIVLISVSSSLGLFFYAGVPATLIIVEVIPFLVLAVGVDNIFILVQAFQRDERQPNETMEEHIGRVVGQVAPSMMLSSVSMSCCFFIGSLTDAPAVKIFALYAGVALLINFFLQMTCFLALFTFDTRREKNNRLDIFCCLKSKRKKANRNQESLLYRFFKNVYAPILLNNYVRITVLFAFLGWLCSSIAVIDKIELGLDQELSMPLDSYMLKYFKYLNEHLTVGPPLYFVVTDGYNYSDKDAQNRICGMAGCDSNSLVAYSQGMQKYSNRTYIALAVNSWLDDYIDYMKSPSCCMIHVEEQRQCTSEEKDYGECVACDLKARRPVGENFDTHIDNFITDIPDQSCPRAGRAQYRDSIEIKNISGVESIGATNFMTYHTVLRTSVDFYKALEWARTVSEELTKTIRGNETTIEARVFPYSLVHVFFEQYLGIWWETVKSLVFSLAAIFAVIFVVLGFDFFSALIVIVTIAMITVNLMGFMYWWNIQLNAVSLVNLVVGVGISVEFCSHLARCFTLSPEPTKLERAREALTKMGSSILSGITLTDCGILALAFAKSEIFKIFYFRMYLGIIIFGTLHSLIFMPVFLSLFGPPVNKKRMYEHRRLRNLKSQESIAMDSVQEMAGT